MLSAKDQEVLFKLKFQAKMLEKQAQKENKNAMKERNIAKRHLAKGERNFAMLHAQNATRSTQLATFIMEQASKVNGMACDVQMAQIQAQSAKTLSAACKEMEKYIGTMDLNKIAAVSVKYDKIRGKMQTANEVMQPTDEMVGLGTESLLSMLEQEIEQEQLADIAPIPSTIPVGGSQKVGLGAPM